MRRYLLDTSLVAAYLLNRPGAISLISPWIQSREVVTSIIVYGEVIEHLRQRSNFSELRRQLRELMTAVVPYYVTYSIMERYAEIRLALRPQGQLIGDADTLIAATALERDLEVVTIDTDFQRVPNLNAMVIPRSQLRRVSK